MKIKWGVFLSKTFASRATGCVHILPTNGRGKVLPGHTMRSNCRCGARRDDKATLVVVHNLEPICG